MASTKNQQRAEAAWNELVDPFVRQANEAGLRSLDRQVTAHRKTAFSCVDFFVTEDGSDYVDLSGGVLWGFRKYGISHGVTGVQITTYYRDGALETGSLWTFSEVLPRPRRWGLFGILQVLTSPFERLLPAGTKGPPLRVSDGLGAVLDHHQSRRRALESEVLRGTSDPLEARWRWTNEMEHSADD